MKNKQISKDFLKKLAEDHRQILVFSMLALMYHKDVGLVVKEYEKKPGRDLAVALIKGFIANPVGQFVKMAYLLGYKEYGNPELE